MTPLATNLLAAANSAGVCGAYYRLCGEYPFISGSNTKKLPYKEILGAANGKILLSKLRGPGTVFQVEGLPKTISINFIIQTGGTIETDFLISEAEQEHRSTFAILCNEALKQAELPAPKPAYPRPVCSSAGDMVAAFVRLLELALVLAGTTNNTTSELGAEQL